MELWVAGLLFLISLIGAAVFAKLYRKNKKTRCIILAAAASLLTLAFAAYVILAFILLLGID